MTTIKHIILTAAAQGTTPIVAPSPTPTPANSSPPLPSFPFDILVQYSGFALLFLLAFLNKNFFRPWLNRGRGFIKRDARMDSEINSILHQMLGVADVDRIVLGVFHNAKFNDDKPNDLMSVSNEAIRLGISSVRMQVKDVPLTKLIKEIIKLKEAPSGKFHTVNIADPTIEDSCRAHMLSIGVRYTANMLLTDSNKELGILSIQVCARIPTLEEMKNLRNTNDIFDEELVRKLSSLADLLTYTLSRSRPNMFDTMWEVIANE